VDSPTMLDQLPDTENSGPEKRKACATVAEPLHELDSRDDPFYRSGTPRQFDRRKNRVFIGRKRPGEARKWG
jgi:hypothetical protein